MFGKSKNALSAMKDVQRIKFGGTAKMSPSQVVCLISNTQDAQRNLSPVEFDQYKQIFNYFRKDTKCQTVDFDGYIEMCGRIISEYEKYFPYLLVDGEHSENIEIRSQIKIRKLHHDGLDFTEALYRYENDYQNIGSFYELDMIGMPIAKKISEQMVSFSVKLHDNLKDYISNATFYNSYGQFLGLFDSIYLDMRDRYLGEIDEIEENAITMYIMFLFANSDFSDSNIDVIMRTRKDTVAQCLPNLKGKPYSQIAEFSELYLKTALSIPASNQGLGITMDLLLDYVKELQYTLLQ